MNTKIGHYYSYEESIQQRSNFHYFIGLIVRWKKQWKYKLARYIARKKGAIIGDGVVMPISLAMKANKNLSIGSHSSIDTDKFSSFSWPVRIGSHVIIGKDVKIVMGSHRLDTASWENYRPNSELIIKDYVWLCPDSVVLPSVNEIGYGSVLGANAVAVKNMKDLTIYGGNPAKEINIRKRVHSDLVVESLKGGDYIMYKKARRAKK